MKKKILAVILCISVLITVFAVGCHKKSKTLVVYVPSSKSVSETANLISISSGGELYELQAKEEYSDAQYNFTDKEKRIENEQKDSKTRVELKEEKNINRYEKIYIVYPVWYKKAPRIILSFLESNEVKDKAVIPVAVSDSGRLEDTLEEVKTSAKGAKLIKGVTFTETVHTQVIQSWTDMIEKDTAETTKKK